MTYLTINLKITVLWMQHTFTFTVRTCLCYFCIMLHFSALQSQLLVWALLTSCSRIQRSKPDRTSIKSLRNWLSCERCTHLLAVLLLLFIYLFKLTLGQNEWLIIFPCCLASLKNPKKCIVCVKGLMLGNIKASGCLDAWHLNGRPMGVCLCTVYLASP